MQADSRYDHIQRLWPIIMAGSVMTMDEWERESEAEKESFYRWIKKQAGEYADLM